MTPRKGCPDHMKPKNRCEACPKPPAGTKWCLCGRYTGKDTTHCGYCDQADLDMLQDFQARSVRRRNYRELLRIVNDPASDPYKEDDE